MKSPLSQLIIVSVICVITLIGYGVWYSAVSAKSAKVAELQNSITAKTETVNRIAATRATLASIAGDEAVVQGYFVPEASVVAFIDSLQAHGRSLGATVSVLSVSTVGTAAAPSLALSLTIRGTFDAVMRTVGSIEHAPYDLSVSALDVAQDGQGELARRPQTARRFPGCGQYAEHTMNISHLIDSFMKRARADTPADPVRDWLVLLSLSAIVLVSIIVWNAWAFDTVSGGGAIGSTTVKAPEVFSQASLNTIRTIFENRAAEEAKYASGIYTFTDPSQ